MVVASPTMRCTVLRLRSRPHSGSSSSPASLNIHTSFQSHRMDGRGDCSQLKVTCSRLQVNCSRLWAIRAHCLELIAQRHKELIEERDATAQFRLTKLTQEREEPGRLDD